MLASKTAHPAPIGLAPASGASYRAQTSGRSPTDGRFAPTYETQDNVRNWNEQTVQEWLKSVNCGHYVSMFRANHISGDNLMDMDQDILRELGVKKLGDRVRLSSYAKLFRHKEFRKRRGHNFDDFGMDPNPPTSASSRNSNTRQGDTRTPRHPGPEVNEPSNWPPSPTRAQKYMALNSLDTYVDPMTSSSLVETPQTARFTDFSRSSKSPLGSPQSTRFGQSISSSQDGSGSLSLDISVIRVIFDDGRSSLIAIEGAKTSEEIIQRTLRTGKLKESPVKSYCFYVLDGTDPNAAYCRRLSDSELVRICTDRSRLERERLIFRKIHTGEPESEQLRAAASIALQQPQPGTTAQSTRSQLKILKLTGESLAAVSYPMSPTSMAERDRHLASTAQDLERSDEGPTPPVPERRARKGLKGFNGGRPPSELVVADPLTYFPDVDKGEIERLNRTSIRRSQRLSRATSRLSTASITSTNLRDAPPIPAIADTWLNVGHHPARLRPLSIVRMGRPLSSYRDSIASSVLEPVDEDSPFEPNRKSYVSFGAESTSDPSGISLNEPQGNTVQPGYFDFQPSGANQSPEKDGLSNSLNEQLSLAIKEDGEEPDEELTEFLQTDSWDNVKYIRGKLIGQGSFGSVYLALHAITGELMAVKQVEVPSTAGTAIDAKKNNMVEALKREIALLRELKHPSIVQYLGSSSDANTLNIFLEYIPGGSIAKMLVDYGSLNENLVANFVRQILVGLAYLHSKDIIHRDIKGANILVDNHGAVKISDFGISKRVEASKSLLLTPTAASGHGPNASAAARKAANRVSLQGSVFWMAPEVVKQTAYTRKADIWSLGCLIVEMLTGSHPHPNCTQLQAIFKIGGSGDASPDVPDAATAECKEFLGRTFEIEYERRPEAEELLKNAWLVNDVAKA